MSSEESKTTLKRQRPDAEGAHGAGFELLQPWLGHNSLAFSMALTTLDAMQAMLQSWRGLIDASRATLRDQQDAALAAMRKQVGGAEARADDNGGTAMLMTPMVGAIKSYSQMTEAMIRAQRQAMRSLTTPESPPH